MTKLGPMKYSYKNIILFFEISYSEDVRWRSQKHLSQAMIIKLQKKEAVKKSYSLYK